MRAGLGEAEVLDLALVNQVFHGPGHVFDGDVWTDPVLVEQVNGLDF